MTALLSHVRKRAHRFAPVRTAARGGTETPGQAGLVLRRRGSLTPSPEGDTGAGSEPATSLAGTCVLLRPT